MADDVAKEIMNCLKLKDRPSPLQLVVRGRDYHTLEFRDVLKVEVPIENGEIVIKVSYYNNRDIDCTEWKTFTILQQQYGRCCSVFGWVHEV